MLHLQQHAWLIARNIPCSFLNPTLKPPNPQNLLPVPHPTKAKPHPNPQFPHVSTFSPLVLQVTPSHSFCLRHRRRAVAPWRRGWPGGVGQTCRVLHTLANQNGLSKVDLSWWLCDWNILESGMMIPVKGAWAEMEDGVLPCISNSAQVHLRYIRSCVRVVTVARRSQ